MSDENNHEQAIDGEDTEASEAVASIGDLSRDELEDQLELAKAEIERMTDLLLRRQAELVNYRRRVQKERAETVAMAQVALLEGLVPVIDDFERAVEAESEDARAYHEGMQLILRSVQKVLEKTGVERIDPLGQAFDPRFHEAIARHETDEVPDGQVLEVYQRGYKLDDRLIRAASVVVAFSGAGAGVDADGDESEPQSGAAGDNGVGDA